jgi:membrane-associated protein
MQFADRIIVSGITAAGPYGLVLLPLFLLLGPSHPALVELVRGSTASIVNMGARASVGQTSFALAVLLGVPSAMMFDWLFWWAGRRWGRPRLRLAARPRRRQSQAPPAGHALA